jgi:hypothetical protein
MAAATRALPMSAGRRLTQLSGALRLPASARVPLPPGRPTARLLCADAGGAVAPRQSLSHPAAATAASQLHVVSLDEGGGVTTPRARNFDQKDR